MLLFLPQRQESIAENKGYFHTFNMKVAYVNMLQQFVVLTMHVKQLVYCNSPLYFLDKRQVTIKQNIKKY